MNINTLFDDISLIVSRDVMVGDHMYNEKNPDHYFRVGHSAITSITAALMLAGRPAPYRILDFACGSGRVTRWLKAIFPGSNIICSDLRQDSLTFLKNSFDVEIVLSNPFFSDISFDEPFDLIWCGSLITHLPQKQTQIFLECCASWLSHDGIAVVTFCGREVKRRMALSEQKYLLAKDAEKIISELEITKYGYVNYLGKDNIGFSICHPEWMLNEMIRLKNSVVILSEAAWDNHQDVLAFRREKSSI
jgi:SAM-dependent methyltransferase